MQTRKESEARSIKRRKARWDQEEEETEKIAVKSKAHERGRKSRKKGKEEIAKYYHEV